MPKTYNIKGLTPSQFNILLEGQKRVIIDGYGNMSDRIDLTNNLTKASNEYNFPNDSKEITGLSLQDIESIIDCIEIADGTGFAERFDHNDILERLEAAKATACNH